MSRKYADRCGMCGRFVADVRGKAKMHEDGTGAYLNEVTGHCSEHGRVFCFWYDDDGNQCDYAWEDFFTDEDEIAMGL
jgi:hypothetical protein